MMQKATIWNIFTEKICSLFEIYRERKNQEIIECCQRYETRRKLISILGCEDTVTFHAKFFE